MVEIAIPRTDPIETINICYSSKKYVLALLVLLESGEELFFNGKALATTVKNNNSWKTFRPNPVDLMVNCYGDYDGKALTSLGFITWTPPQQSQEQEQE